jgi:hypothetical protein
MSLASRFAKIFWWCPPMQQLFCVLADVSRLLLYGLVLVFWLCFLLTCENAMCCFPLFFYSCGLTLYVVWYFYEWLYGTRRNNNNNNNNNKKFWREQIANFLFIVIWVSDTIRRKKTLVCMRNEVNKTIQFERLQCWYYWSEWLMKYAVGMASGGVIYIPSLMTIGSGIRVILRVLPQQSERRNVGITDKRELWCTHWDGLSGMIYKYQVSWRLVQVFKQY